MVLVLALAQPMEVLEQWDILATVPLLENVTARAVYFRSAGPWALLPAAVQGRQMPRAFAVGVRRDLLVRRGTLGWEVRLPPGERDSVRVVARVVRPVRSARWFRLSWPVLSAARVPTRRVVTVPRQWMVFVPPEWSCPREPVDGVPCVSTVVRPRPLQLQLPPPPSHRGVVVFAILVVVLVAAFAVSLGPDETRRHRLVGALGGVVVGLAVTLGLVGAWALSIPVALSLATVPAVILGAWAPRNRSSTMAAGLALLIVPLVVVFDGRLGSVIAASVVFFVVVSITAWLPVSDRR